MNLLIKQALIVDPESQYNGKRMDILIENENIVSVEKSIKADNATVFETENLHVSPGWFDLHASFRDPGHEYKEDLHSGIEAAANGGFTAVMVMPSTFPPIDNKSAVEYVINQTRGNIVDILPTGCLSAGMEGKDISEMFDMRNAGAIAFTDDKQSVSDAGLLLRALLYSKGFDGLIMNFPDDKNLSQKGQMNEGVKSTELGLKGIPDLAEELMVARDIYLAEYSEAPIHFSTISTKGAVEQIRRAKSRGLKITADVAAHNLVLNDQELEEFDSNYKVMPPLRTEETIKELLKGLMDGTIDAICSDHRPEDEENKKREFDHAAFGIAGLETTFAVLNQFSSLPIEEIIKKLTIGPRLVLGLPQVHIRPGAEANLTLFSPDHVWTPSSQNLKSKSVNNPFIGKNLKGRAIGIINKGMFHSNE